MYQGIILPDSSVLEDLKFEHLKTLVAPMDAYWEEALIGFADHYEFTIDGIRAGFYCLNTENQLVAFHLSREYANHGEDALSHITNEHSVPAALVGTNDPYFLSLCLDVATSTKVHTLLFQDNCKLLDKRERPDKFSFDLAAEADFDDVFKHYCAASGAFDTESVETGFDDIKGYVRSVMNDHHIFALREGGKLIATSECRISKTQMPYADVGMIVAEEHRRRGVGSDILARTKAYCYELGAKPICSCEAGNMGSKKAVTKAGFVSQHRIILAEFGI